MSTIFENDVNETGTSFIMHKNADKTWNAGGEVVSLDKIMICPDTIKTGWGMWNGSYETKYSDTPFVKIPKPEEGYKEAFSMNIYTNDNKQYLWSRFSFGEYQAFKKLAVEFYKDIEANKGKVPVFEYTNTHEVIELKALNINVPLFTFLGWKDRPADFVVPVWNNPEPMIADGEVSMSEKVAAATQAQIDRQELTDDDIPF
jgi:hypothetical protein|tara:strand:+ start:1282 stop:1887 length:606 start_codon:yes stop_codon:yes gene_type:complete